MGSQHGKVKLNYKNISTKTLSILKLEAIWGLILKSLKDALNNIRFVESKKWRRERRLTMTRFRTQMAELNRHSADEQVPFTE